MRRHTRTLSLVVLALLTVCAGATPAVAADVSTVDDPTTDGAPSPADHTPPECSFPVTLTDATGTEVTVNEAPETVVTLSPSAAQTMWELGAQGKVVGVTQYATYLEGASEKANVSGSGQSFASVEKVVALDPDLVLAPNVVPNETVSKLRDAGLTVYKTEGATSIEDVMQKTETVARLTDECAASADVVDGMRADLETVSQAVDGEDRPRVLYYFFGFTAGEGTFVDEIITTAGGTNVASEAGITGFKQISPETVVEQNPEWIVLNSDDPQGVPANDAFNSTTAVREGNTVTLDANLISQPAPRIVEPVTKLARTFHPEAYAAANATATETATPTPVESTTSDPPGTTATTGTATTTETTTPGFGPAVTGAALLGLAVVALRRR